MSKRVVIAGASGLIGSNLLTLALEHQSVSEVLVLVRKDLPIQHPKLRQIKVSFDQLEQYSDLIQGDVIFCCLGSTKAKTPHEEDYRKVDYDYPFQLGKIGVRNNIPQYHLVSALGADKNSFIFYSRLKGEIEEAVQKLNFTSIYVYRPSLLTGNRKEHRTGEKLIIKLMNFLNPLLIGPLKKYRSIDSNIVARAMLNQCLKDSIGIFIYPSDKIRELA
jgi:uncharacterized protein YbjT (DUF2867 family)